MDSVYHTPGVPYIEQFYIPDINPNIPPLFTDEYLRERNKVVIARYKWNSNTVEAYQNGSVCILDSATGDIDCGYEPNFKARFPRTGSTRLGNAQKMKEYLYVYRSQ